MKAIIVTLYDSSPNFGNRLQNYAVQSVLKSLGFEVQTISYEKSRISTLSILKSFAQKLTGYRLTGNRFYWECVFEKCKVFDRFNKNYINTVQVSRVEDIDLNSDYFVVGSDQVWNPSWYNNPLKKEMFLLTFAPNKKKVCFAPSFGVEELPIEWEDWFKENLSNISNVSVREEAGAKIIYQLTGKEVPVLIDPTLMLDKEEWKIIEKKPSSRVDLKAPYILTYFLGDIPTQAEQDIERICEEKKLKVHHLMNYDDPAVYTSGPSEFIYLIDHASLILTDSFHACVFSFLFKKPFMAYARDKVDGNMLSRLETLFSKFDLGRKFVKEDKPHNMDEIFECDYSEGYSRLSLEREKVKKYLRQSLKLE